MYNWVSLYWVWLLPGLATLGTLAQLRAVHLAHRRDLVNKTAWRYLLAALLGAQALIWSSQAALVFETNSWLSGSGLAAIGLMLASLYRARPHIHPGLRGFLRPMPADGLALLMLEPHPRRRMIRRGLPLLPPLILLLYIASAQPQRWPDFLFFGMTLTAPLLLVPFRIYWLLPMLLAGPVGLLFVEALIRQPGMPPGVWATPVTGADCKGQLRISPPWAWCLNAVTTTVYRFDLHTGVVSLDMPVTEGASVFAANAEFAWVQQNPARGLVVVEAVTGTTTALPVISAHSGVADTVHRVWVIDVSHELWLHSNGTEAQVNARDGLLNNTAGTVKTSRNGDVWVGSMEGLSWLKAGMTEWQTRNGNGVIPGTVRNIAFAPGQDNGALWLLWQARNLRSWGVTLLEPEGVPRATFDIGRETGLEFPLAEESLAVDGLGRVWFVSQAIAQREKYLGLYTPGDVPQVQVHSLGKFEVGGPYGYGGGLWQESFGVTGDGEGGIILFNGAGEPWRYWRP